MKILLVGVAIIFAVGCNNNNKAGGNPDSTAKVAGNSAGAITTKSDTASMDTGLGKIMTDSAK